VRLKSVATILRFQYTYVYMVGKFLQPPKTDILSRLYLALALRRLWQHESVWKVAQRFQLTRGYVQNLLQSCASFSHCLARFCEVKL